jgi:hypothetical protein
MHNNLHFTPGVTVSMYMHNFCAIHTQHIEWYNYPQLRSLDISVHPEENGYGMYTYDMASVCCAFLEVRSPLPVSLLVTVPVSLLFTSTSRWGDRIS